MPHGEMTITLQDVEVLLGLPVDGRPLVASPNVDTSEAHAKINMIVGSE
jgi:hypothetical protein